MCTVICLCFFSWYSLCWLYLAFPFSIITPFILNPSATSSFFSSLMLPLPFPFFCFWLDPSLPTCPSPQDPSALLLPLVPSQTNGAHYKLTKNSPAAKSIHFFFFLSFCLSPFLMLLFFFLFRTSLRREMSNGEKACQLIYQLAACRSLCYQGWAAEAVGPGAWDWAHGCLSVMVLTI